FDLHRDGPKAVKLPLGRGDLGVEALRLPFERPVAPSDEERRQDDNQAAADGQLLADVERRLGFCTLPFPAEEIDADHRSPARRSARPTATTAVGARRSESPTPRAPASNAILRNGSNGSTGTPKRSSSA